MKTFYEWVEENHSPRLHLLEVDLGRRNFLKMGAAAAGASMIPGMGGMAMGGEEGEQKVDSIPIKGKRANFDGKIDLYKEPHGEYVAKTTIKMADGFDDAIKQYEPLANELRGFRDNYKKALTDKWENMPYKEKYPYIQKHGSRSTFSDPAFEAFLNNSLQTQPEYKSIIGKMESIKKVIGMRESDFGEFYKDFVGEVAARTEYALNSYVAKHTMPNDFYGQEGSKYLQKLASGEDANKPLASSRSRATHAYSNKGVVPSYKIRRDKTEHLIKIAPDTYTFTYGHHPELSQGHGATDTVGFSRMHNMIKSGGIPSGYDLWKKIRDDKTIPQDKKERYYKQNREEIMRGQE